MATVNSSSRFMRLANTWRHLAMRCDVDDIIVELIGRFSLEKVYSEGNQEAYQRLVTTLLVQLDAIFFFQRLSLPAEGQHAAPYIGFIASWEVIVRSVEFVLQVIVEGREGLWEAQTLRDRHLADMLLSSLRILSLHPKPPGSQGIKDRRDRFFRIHSSLERLYDNYPGSKSFSLSVCKEVTHALLTEPSALVLPPKLRYELPNLASELYPLPDCLSSRYVSTIVPQDARADRWLSSYLALRDVAHFVLAASLQSTVDGETRDLQLQSSSAKTRDALFTSLDNLRLPQQFSKVDLMAGFSSIFQIILLDTPSLGQEAGLGGLGDESEADAFDALCRSLFNRQLLHRVSDQRMMHNLSEITRSISLLDDPSGRDASTSPRVYALNCRTCHIAGDTQLRYLENLEFPDPSKGPEVNLPEETRCIECGETVTVAREIPLARKAWSLLKPLQPNAESISVERHMPHQFQLTPPKNDPGMPFHSPYAGHYGRDEGSTSASGTAPLFSTHHPKQEGQTQERNPTLSEGYFSQRPFQGSPLRKDTPLSEPIPSERVGTIDGTTQRESQAVLTRGREASDVSSASSNTPPTPGYSLGESIETRMENESSAPDRRSTFGRSNTIEKKEKKPKWGGLFQRKTSKRDPLVPSAETSSISSSILERQRLENVPLGSLLASSKSRVRGKPHVNICLSPNSTHALFWTQAVIQIWDVGTSPPTFMRVVSFESTCLIAAVAKSYLVYITGSQQQKLTLKIVNLAREEARVVEFNMSSVPWCRSIAINPQETCVVVGFDNSIVRFFQLGHSGEPREQRLLARFNNEYPKIETLSFSQDGLTLTASMRSQISGWVQVYVWKYPFNEALEVTACRYKVPLHESEDCGVSSAISRPKGDGNENLICITTWTQFGSPILVQPENGNKVDINAMPSGNHRRVGSRMQTASFSPSGKHLALVNEKGNVYEVSHLNSNIMEVKKLSTSMQLTTRSDSFAMGYMTLHEEEAIVLAWADSKGEGHVKKIPVMHSGETNLTTAEDMVRESRPELPTVVEISGRNGQSSTSQSPAHNNSGDQKTFRAELAATDLPVPPNRRKMSGAG